MKKKGIFAYDFFDDLSKLNETMLPPQEVFKDTLNDKDCSNDEYKHAELVWKTFQCKTFREYHDLYLKSDVLLLTDFFEKFRETCLESYGLDAAHYYSTPGMAWSCAMKLTDTRLELLDNEEMYTFFERSIRGGISQVSKRHVRANNKCCKTYNYDPEKPTTFLVYLDANNLYGFALSQKLPTGDFIWYPENQFEKWTEKDILDFDTDGEFGEILEVDIHIPSELHDCFNDYPPAPERLEIDDSMWSPFQKECFPDYKKKPTVKLSPNLLDKTKYVVHMRNLQFYIRHGCKVTKIHRVLSFKQSNWLKKDIDFNTDMRTKSKSKFEKDFYKLMNNSVFGKTQENLRNRMNVEIITNRKIALKRACKPSMKRSETIHENLVVMETAVTNLVLNKPIYIGFCVLELSKLLMYQFHYEKIINWFEKVTLCYTDTDSFLYEIQSEDIKYFWNIKMNLTFPNIYSNIHVMTR